MKVHVPENRLVRSRRGSGRLTTSEGRGPGETRIFKERGAGETGAWKTGKWMASTPHWFGPFGCDLVHVADAFESVEQLREPLLFGLLTAKAHPDEGYVPEIAYPGYARRPIRLVPVARLLASDAEVVIEIEPRRDERPTHGGLWDAAGRLLAHGPIGGRVRCFNPASLFEFEANAVRFRPPSNGAEPLSVG